MKTKITCIDASTPNKEGIYFSRRILQNLETQLNQKEFKVTTELNKDAPIVGKSIIGSAQIDSNKLICEVELDKPIDGSIELVWQTGETRVLNFIVIPN